MARPKSPFGAPEEPVEAVPLQAPKKKEKKERKEETFSQDLINAQRKRVERDETDKEVTARLKVMKKDYEEMKKIFG